MTIAWSHVNIQGGTTDDAHYGVAWAGSGNPNGTHAQAAGGYIGDVESSVAVTDEVIPNCPMVGTYVEYDSGSDTTFMQVGFAVPPGKTVRAHIWVIY